MNNPIAVSQQPKLPSKLRDQSLRGRGFNNYRYVHVSLNSNSKFTDDRIAYHLQLPVESIRILFPANCQSWTSSRSTCPNTAIGAIWGLYYIECRHLDLGSSYSLYGGINMAKLINTNTEKSFSYTIRPMVEIPLSSFTLEPADTISQFDYEISSIHN